MITRILLNVGFFVMLCVVNAVLTWMLIPRSGLWMVASLVWVACGVAVLLTHKRGERLFSILTPAAALIPVIGGLMTFASAAFLAAR